MVWLSRRMNWTLASWIALHTLRESGVGDVLLQSRAKSALRHRSGIMRSAGGQLVNQLGILRMVFTNIAVNSIRKSFVQSGTFSALPVTHGCLIRSAEAVPHSSNVPMPAGALLAV